MGKIKPDMAGFFINSIGNVVYYQRAGENLVRSKSKVPYTSNTPAQQLQKSKFGDMTHLAATIKFVAEVGFPQRGKGLSPANAFHRANRKCYMEDKANGVCVIDFAHLVCSQGSLFPPLVVATMDIETKTLKIDSEVMSEESGCNIDDTVYAVVLDKQNLFCRLIDVCERGEKGTKSIQLPKFWSVEETEIYTFAVTGNGKSASKTVYVTMS